MNTLYNNARFLFLTNGGLNWTSDTIKVLLINSAHYTFSQSHQNLSDIPSTAIIATSPQLTSVSATDGVASADPIIFPSVAGSESSGYNADAIVIFKDTGTPSTSTLIAFMDMGINNMPYTVNGSNITIQWDTGLNGIFQL